MTVRRKHHSNIEKQEKKLKRNRGWSIAWAHEPNSSFSKVKNMCVNDINDFHMQYWKLNNTVEERQFIQRNISVSSVSRRRTNEDCRVRNREVVTKFFVQSSDGPMQVCIKPMSILKPSFLSILSIGRMKAELAAKQIVTLDEDMKEKRGGARVNNAMKTLKENIVKHIQSFRCREKHQSRSKSPGRSYLPPELNIMTMWNIFCESNTEKCNYSLYYSVFTQN